jgi:hypothetical protein
MNNTLFGRISLFCLLALSFSLSACGGGGSQGSSGPDTCLDLPGAQGCMAVSENILNLSIVSSDPNDLKAEYQAGFLQGRLQGQRIVSARDNQWDSAYLTDPSHTFPKQLPISAQELALARGILLENLRYTQNYIGRVDPALAHKLLRIIYRMLGVYHGVVSEQPVLTDFPEGRFPDFSESDLTLNYGTAGISFLDVYALSAYADLMDVMDGLVSDPLGDDPEKCSAFVKRTADDVLITHNTWSSFLNQSCSLSLYVNGDYVSANMSAPGYIVSNSDFGYNNKGLMFNETTHHATYMEPKAKALWTFMRAALAEQFAGSLDEFFSYISLETSGTYLNGYMLVNAASREIGLIEMSYRSFIYFKSNAAGGYDITTKPSNVSKEYDQQMVQPDYILGINYPASIAIRDDLKAVDNRPARKEQFLAMIGGVNDIDSAKELITYTDPENPLSIYGRWDLGYGTTDYPKTVPDGSIDAKVWAASMLGYVWSLEGRLDPQAGNPAFWMKYGTAYIKGEPFVWSRSQWSSQTLRDVPDRQDGSFVLLPSWIR